MHVIVEYYFCHPVGKAKVDVDALFALHELGFLRRQLDLT